MLFKLLGDLIRPSHPAPAPEVAEREPVWPLQTRHTGALTLIIPSVASRAALFERALEVLSKTQVKWKILVTDHSEDSKSGVLAAIAERFPALNIEFIYHAPDAHFVERITDCAAQATTAYVALHADDDFLITTATESCIDRLESDAACAAVKGQIAFFIVNKEAKITGDLQDGYPRFEDDRAARTLNHVASFSPTLYAVHRREVFVSAYRTALAQNPNVIFWQYLGSAWTVAAGHVAVINELFYIREFNPIGWRAKLVDGKDPTHWPYLVTAPDFSSQLATFRQHLAEGLAGDVSQLQALEMAATDACLYLVSRAMGGGST